MRLLLDTQVFIWWNSDSQMLPPHLLQLCEDDSNTLVLSVASIWEIQIKVQIGKLELKRPLAETIHSQQNENQFELLSIEAKHIYGLQQLPLHHKDPFDRLLIAQSNVERLPLVSVDSQFSRYSVHLIH